MVSLEEIWQKYEEYQENGSNVEFLAHVVGDLLARIALIPAIVESNVQQKQNDKVFEFKLRLSTAISLLGYEFSQPVMIQDVVEIISNLRNMVAGRWNEHEYDLVDDYEALTLLDQGIDYRTYYKKHVPKVSPLVQHIVEEMLELRRKEAE